MYGLFNDYGWGYGMMGGPVGGFMMIALWVLLIVFIVWVVREVSGRHSGIDSRALDILKERYAKGEIGKEEFETKKKDLS
ncbi:MAG: SHOCT domain-containing protein [Patescibacteria group bacterium]|mgnify:CR=1 FL=1